MKNKMIIGLSAVLLFSSVAAYADGNMSTGNKNCTQNCGGLYEAPVNEPVITETPDSGSEESILTWLETQITELFS